MDFSGKDREDIEQKPAGSVSSDDKHEFMLHLYDKLWENIVNKENRTLWTFLTVYGAGIRLTVLEPDDRTSPSGCRPDADPRPHLWAMELIPSTQIGGR